MKAIFIIFALITCTLPMIAQQSYVPGEDNGLPKYSNEYLSIGVGARALGMANACIATTGDVTAGYWNPAGLASQKQKYDIGMMHSSYFGGMANYDYLGGSYKIDSLSSVGLTLIRFGVDDIKNTLDAFDKDGNLDYDRIKQFSVADYAMLVSYSRRTKNPKLQYGANVKIIYRQQGEFANAYGFGFDAAVQYNTGKWRLAAVGRDITSTFNAWLFDEDKLKSGFDLTDNKMPENTIEVTLPKLILGVSRSFVFSENFSGLAEIDAEITFDGKRNVLVSSNPVSLSPNAGFEVAYKEFVYVRGGVCNVQEISDWDNKSSYTIQPNAGIGIRFAGFTLDYALTDLGDMNVAEYSHVFSLRYTFGGVE